LVAARLYAAFGGTSPVMAGGLRYVYDPKGKLRMYEPKKGDQSRISAPVLDTGTVRSWSTAGSRFQRVTPISMQAPALRLMEDAVKYFIEKPSLISLRNRSQ
jgi:hypothetical protein